MLKRLRKPSRKLLAEGFGPVYREGIIAPEFEGLGPKYEKDLFLKIMPPSKHKKEKKYKRKILPDRPGKRWYA